MCNKRASTVMQRPRTRTSTTIPLSCHTELRNSKLPVEVRIHLRLNYLAQGPTQGTPLTKSYVNR